MAGIAFTMFVITLICLLMGWQCRSREEILRSTHDKCDRDLVKLAFPVPYLMKLADDSLTGAKKYQFLKIINNTIATVSLCIGIVIVFIGV